MNKVLQISEEESKRFAYIGKLDERLQINTDIRMIKDHIKKLNQVRAEFQDDLIHFLNKADCESFFKLRRL